MKTNSITKVLIEFNITSKILFGMWLLFDAIVIGIFISLQLGYEYPSIFRLIELLCLSTVVFLHPALMINDVDKIKAVASENQYSDKSFIKTVILTVLFGYLGIHRFYTGRYITGVICLFSYHSIPFVMIIDLAFLLLGKYCDGDGKYIVSTVHKKLYEIHHEQLNSNEEGGTHIDDKTVKFYFDSEDQIDNYGIELCEEMECNEIRIPIEQSVSESIDKSLVGNESLESKCAELWKCSTEWSRSNYLESLDKDSTITKVFGELGDVQEKDQTQNDDGELELYKEPSFHENKISVEQSEVRAIDNELIENEKTKEIYVHRCAINKWEDIQKISEVKTIIAYAENNDEINVNHNSAFDLENEHSISLDDFTKYAVQNGGCKVEKAENGLSNTFANNKTYALVSNGERVKKELDQVAFNYGIGALSTRKEKNIYVMKKYEKYEGEKVDYYSFQMMLPTYFDMNPKQLEYYFYWRSEMRNGIGYHLISEAYIMIYIYELLLEIGWNKPEDGYKQLLFVWEINRMAYPNLDKILLEWTFDFAKKYELEYVIPEFFDISDGFEYREYLYESTACLYNEILTVKREKQLLELSFNEIIQMIDYDIRESRFFRLNNFEYAEMIKEIIPKVVLFVDKQLKNSEGKGILEKYGPKRKKNIKRKCFKGLEWLLEQDEFILIEQYTFHTVKEWRMVLTFIVKYVENILRSKANINGRVKVSNDYASIGIIVDSYFDGLNSSNEDCLKKNVNSIMQADVTLLNNKCEKRKRGCVKLDSAKISDIRKQSDAVRDALEVERECVETIITDKQAENFVETLSDELITFLINIRGLGWKIAAQSSEKNKAHQLNKLAEMEFAQTCIYEAQGNLYVFEMWQDVLDKYLEGYIGKELQDNKGDSLGAVIFNLSKSQKEVLRIILREENIEEKIARIADEEFSLPEILIDEINSIAVSIFKDIIINTQSESIEVFEEYIDEIKAVLDEEK